MMISLMGSFDNRFSRSEIFKSSGSTPSSGEIFPPRTWNLPRNVPDFSTLKISTARSTTQTSDESRRESSQIGQGDFSVSEPQVVQNWIFSRASKIESASCFTIVESV